MKSLIFAGRNAKEILRDPISYTFSLGFPILMLIIFRIINYYSDGNWMTMDMLVPGVCVFSFAFVMLYMSLLVSKDRSASFLSRLFTSPMKASDFIIGYTLPGVVIGLCQSFICFVCGLIISLCSGGEIHNGAVVIKTTALNITTGMSEVTVSHLYFSGVLLCIAICIPVVIMFVSFGILFGSLLNEKSAPGISSIIITASGFLSGAWMPLQTMGTYENVCLYLPFYPAVRLCRAAITLGDICTDRILFDFVIVILYMFLIFALSILVFKKKMTADNK